LGGGETAIDFQKIHDGEPFLPKFDRHQKEIMKAGWIPGFAIL
jgi:hypothetical protein